MRRAIATFGVAFAAALGVVGCGGSSPPPPAPQQVKICSGLTDRCQTAPLQQLERKARLTPFPGCRIPDVSDYQGYVNWTKAKPYVCGGIVKGGEGGGYGGGSLFYRNWVYLRQLGLWHAMYWFVRPTWVSSCSTQASLIIGRMKSVGYPTDHLAGPIQLDEEVPGSNLTSCLTAAIQRAFPGRPVDNYTAPGTWPGGSHGSNALWQATYGPSLVPFWLPVVAWQCTDGIHGCVTYIPGIGFGDVSSNRGITSQVPPRPVTILHCLAKKYPHVKTCYQVRFTYHKLVVDQARVHKRLVQHGCYARRHPGYCKGWLHAQTVDSQRLKSLVKRYK